MSSTPGSALGAPAVKITSVEHRVVALRELGDHDPGAARDLAWSWFRDLSRRAARDRAATAAELDVLFRCGTVPVELDGQTEGMLVSLLLSSSVDLGLRALTGAWMPWLGIRFDRGEERGENTVRADARWPMKLLWPGYATRAHPLGRAALDFVTSIEPGRADPDRHVLKLDYAPIADNPLLVRMVHDEIVQIVPGANLGKILFRTGPKSWETISWFALRSGTASIVGV